MKKQQKKTLSIAKHQGNANQKHDELSPYTHQNGCLKNKNRK
jgi:hypothetical protein